MYAVTSCTAKALNGGEDDILTKMVAGCASGAVFGVPSTSVPVAHTRACLMHWLVEVSLLSSLLSLQHSFACTWFISASLTHSLVLPSHSIRLPTRRKRNFPL